MSRRDTLLGGGERAFPATRWSLIAGAGASDPDERRVLLEDLISRYWKPVYAYLRAAGRLDIERAKDLTQAFFSRLLEKETLARLDPDGGSFRGFLKRSARNFMIDASRREAARRPRGEKKLFRFEDHDLDSELVDEEDAGALFDRQWNSLVLREGLDALRDQLEARDRTASYETFCAYCWPEDDPGPERSGKPTYRELAERFGITENEISHHLKDCRKELKRILRERIRDYVLVEEEIDTEWKRILAG